MKTFDQYLTEAKEKKTDASSRVFWEDGLIYGGGLKFEKTIGNDVVGRLSAYVLMEATDSWPDPSNGDDEIFIHDADIDTALELQDKNKMAKNILREFSAAVNEVPGLKFDKEDHNFPITFKFSKKDLENVIEVLARRGSKKYFTKKGLIESIYVIEWYLDKIAHHKFIFRRDDFATGGDDEKEYKKQLMRNME